METLLSRTKLCAAKPFLKWAGGKGQLIPTLKANFPSQLLEGKINKYIEPFIGGGAVFFDLVRNFDFREVVISDINKDLVNTYKTVKENVNELVEALSGIQNNYLSLNTEDRKSFYYNMREKFNLVLFDDQNYRIERAATFIFLNRTCFNGLYRVNRSGAFNVPHGDYSNPTICDIENLLVVSELLKDVDIVCNDFRNLPWEVDESTFIYFDPPYRPLNITSNFTSYNEQDFNDNDQIELSNLFINLDRKGAFLMLSNSDPKNTNDTDDFFDKIYNGFTIQRVQAKRAINSRADNRGSISEILVTNYNF